MKPKKNAFFFGKICLFTKIQLSFWIKSVPLHRETVRFGIVLL